MFANVNVVVRHQTPERRRQFGHAAAVVVPARAQGRNVILGHPMRAKQFAGRIDRVTRGTVGDHVRRQEFRLRHGQCRTKASCQPCRIAKMIRMVVRGDDALDGTARERGREMRFPEGSGRGIAVAAIDLGPAVAVGEQPQIDVVESERQRHAQPADAAHDLDDLGGRGRSGVGEFEDGG